MVSCLMMKWLGGGGKEYFWSGTALQLGFDAPRQRWLSILVKDDVIAEGIDVLRVNEESVHVEQAGPNVGKTVLVRSEGEDLVVKESW